GDEEVLDDAAAMVAAEIEAYKKMKRTVEQRPFRSSQQRSCLGAFLCARRAGGLELEGR
ncbi:unnamed protein product, partial [Phaeothamnion confervicola]